MATRVYIGRLARDARERDVEKLFRNYGTIREIKLMNGFGFVEFRDHRDADDVVYAFNGKSFMGENRFAPPQRNPQYRLIVENLSSSCSWQVCNYVPKIHTFAACSSRYLAGLLVPYSYVPEIVQIKLEIVVSYAWKEEIFWLPLLPSLDMPTLVPSIGIFILVLHIWNYKSPRGSLKHNDLKDLMRKAGEVTFADCHKDRDGEGVVEFSSYEDMKNAIRKLDDTELKGKRIILREAPSPANGKDAASRSVSPRRRDDSRSPKRSRSQSGERERVDDNHFYVFVR
ncbi:11291_t:CDS:2 [Funneliformis caledonium]|uniref:11291_t:CDS:1 n=1 Tax=Funneliformis caledonium TaxID=1117310 RepID=A0A9N8VLH3_9GLOM|nr:11291_t:CDS:2 [Funneliformis caledonium]